VYIPSEDTTMAVKISFPEKWTKNDKIILWSMPPLNDNFLPDSILDEKRNLWMPPVLRTALLDSGYVNIEYIERNDSIEFARRKYRVSDSNTKAKDLENLLDYIKSVRKLKNKKIILIGSSGGGDVNSKVASKRQSDIQAMLHLACSAISGKKIADYQRNRSHRKLLWSMGKFASSRTDLQADMDSAFNKSSSLDSYHKADLEGIAQFFEENWGPLEDILFHHESMDSIYSHIDLYLRDRWEKEDDDTKGFFLYENDFEKYYNVFTSQSFITPHQIMLRKSNPEDYYPLITCPVMAVHGTEDERIDCYPNMEAMEQLLKQGGNNNFKKMILEEYNHSLAKGSNGHVDIPHPEIEGFFISASSKPTLHIEDEVIQEIIKWIDEQ
jgi:pimeloyl-ACP methyl ester carboxylesterase